MGALCGGGSESTTINEATKLPEYITQGGKELFGQAQQLMATPYQPYGQPRLADYSPNQKQAIYTSSANAGGYQPELAESGELARLGATQFGDADIGAYMNPYAENVIDIAGGKVEEAYNRDTQNLNARAVAQGALGGSRNELERAELGERKNETIGNLYLTGLGQSYDEALKAFNADRSAAFTGANQFGQLASLEGGLNLQDLTALMQTGDLARELPQASLDTAYQDFLNQQNYPYQQLNFASGTLTGTPYDKSTTSTQTGGGGDTAAQLTGTAMMAAALMMSSDRRVKKNIRKVGELDNKLPVYSFKYKAGGPTQIGLMAQDVEKVKPEAVGQLDGFKAVNYDLAVAA